MRKLLLRLFNLIYIAAAGVSIYFLATRPIIQTTAKINLSGEQVSKLLEPLLKKSSGGSGSSERAYTRAEEGEGSSSSNDFSSYLTPEKIAEAFKDGIHQDIVIKVDATKAYQFNNKDIIKEVVTDNIYSVMDSVLDVAVPPLRSLVLSVAGEFAKDALKEAINEQLQHFIGEDSTVSSEQVSEIYQNIYDLLETEGSVSVSDLTDVIINGKEKEDGTMSTGALEILNETPRYVLAEPQPTAINEGDEYYVKDADDNYVLATEYDPTAQYYVIKPYTSEDIDQEKIEQVMTEALEEVPGLVSKNYVLVEKDSSLQTKVEATIKSDRYFVKTNDDPETYEYATSWNESTQYYQSVYVKVDDSELPQVEINPANYFIQKDGDFVQATAYVEGTDYYKYYEHFEVAPSQDEVVSSIKSLTYFWKVDEENYTNVTHWDPEKDYYTYEVKVNDIDTALTYLLNQYLGGKGEESHEGGSRAIVRAEEANLGSTQSEAELRELLKKFIIEKIPLDAIVNLNSQFGQYVPYVLLGIIVLFCLPWGWFALVSLIRTFRKRKCWTRPGIIIFGAFIQLILGIFVTYGLQYAIPLIGNAFPQAKPYLDMVSIDIRFGCLIASFVYLGVFIMSIFYWIIARKVKVEYKFDKQLARYEKAQARGRR